MRTVARQPPGQRVVPLTELEDILKKSQPSNKKHVHTEDEINFGDVIRFYSSENKSDKRYIKFKDYFSLQISSSDKTEFEDEFKIIPALRVLMLDKASNFKTMLDDDEDDEPEKVFASA